MAEWIKSPMGPDGGRWEISNGELTLYVHPTYDGSMRLDVYPDGVIVSKEAATDYADFVVSALNEAEKARGTK